MYSIIGPFWSAGIFVGSGITKGSIGVLS